MVRMSEDGCVPHPILRYHSPHTQRSDSYDHSSSNARTRGTCRHVHFVPLLLPYRAPELSPTPVDVSTIDSASNGTI